MLESALAQAWPPFVLVVGLLLVGLVAGRDGFFEWLAAGIERLPGPPAVMLAALLVAVAAVTAVLNLDTAVVFLTPVLIHAARRRGASERPFLYGSIFMANAGSLFLPGSNLTNLLVLDRDPAASGGFASHLLVAGLAATAVTALGTLLLFSGELRTASPTQRVVPARGRGVPWLGICATLAAAVPVVLLRNPAPAVLGLGLALAALELVRGRLAPARVAAAIGPGVLSALFVLSVGLGVLARTWAGPATLLAHAGRWGTAALGALGAVTINNLPAAVLLSARPPAHPRALLIGLDIGPNLAVTGSLSAWLWWRASREVGAKPSAATLSRRGAVLAPLAIVAALVAAGSSPGLS